VGWNGHEKPSEKAELMWRAKALFLKLKIVLLHEAADHRKPQEKRLGVRYQER
jgi:hypothetical protein